MNIKSKMLFGLSLLLALSMLFSACAPPAAPTEAPVEEPQETEDLAQRINEKDPLLSEIVLKLDYSEVIPISLALTDD